MASPHTLHSSITLCLCRRCALVFYESPKHRVVRANPVQVIKEPCDYCRTRPGLDFIISVPRTRHKPGTSKSTRLHWEHSF